MAAHDFKDTHSWQSAIALGAQLMELAEAMPATEELGLSWQLRKSMVRLPAAIALDLDSDKKGRFGELYRLVATLELIDKVYPALDTAAAKSAVDKLTERLSGPDFDERLRGKAPAPRPPQPPDTPTQPAAAAPQPADNAHHAPSTVPVLEAPTPQPGVSVPVQPTEHPQSPDVQQHSGQ
jgi:hypothetical protein